MPRRLGLLIAVLVLAGCGSTQVAAERPEPERSPVTFRSDARSVCAALQRRVAALALPERPDDPRLLHGLADEWAETVRELRRLDPPAQERPKFRRMLEHFDRAIRGARALPTAEDELALAAVVGFLDQGARGSRIAESLGLPDCSALPAAQTERELAELRKRFGSLLPLQQPAQARRVGPRVKAPSSP